MSRLFIEPFCPFGPLEKNHKSIQIYWNDSKKMFKKIESTNFKLSRFMS